MSNQFSSQAQRERYELAKIKATFGKPKKIRKVNSSKLFQHLGLLFIGLKLTGYVTWSWWFVLAPLMLDYAFWYVGQKALEYVQRKAGYLPDPKDF